jgi:hypothetical protein
MTTEAVKTPAPAPNPAPPPAPNPAPPPAPSPTASTSTDTPAAPSGTDLGTEDTKPNGAAQPNGSVEQSTDLGTEPEPTPASEGESPPPWAEFHGAPAEGEDYEIVAPDGFAPDDSLRAEFVPVARELNLSPKGAQKLVDLHAKNLQLQSQRWGEHLTELRSQAQADPEIGGAKYLDAVAAGRRVISKYGTPGLRKLMNDYGVGAHPEMIRFMRKIDTAMGEPSTLPSGDGPGVVKEKPLHEILYKDS